MNNDLIRAIDLDAWATRDKRPEGLTENHWLILTTIRHCTLIGLDVVSEAVDNDELNKAQGALAVTEKIIRKFEL